MRFERMRPAQLRAAIEAGTPFVLPIGVMEYHGGHLPVGVDMLAVTEVLARLEPEVVLLPPFPYGAASHAVAGPEGTGNLHIDATAIVPFAEGLFTALLRGGFRNIHGVIHHQTENFAQGMPTDLAFRLAARNAIFRFLEEDRGTSACIRPVSPSPAWSKGYGLPGGNSGWIRIQSNGLAPAACWA